jgi:uncharacterized protein
VRAGAKLSKVEQSSEQELTVWTTAAPEKGRANKVVIKQLAKHLRIRPSEIELVHGHTSSKKQFRIQKHSD